MPNIILCTDQQVRSRACLPDDHLPLHQWRVSSLSSSLSSLLSFPPYLSFLPSDQQVRSRAGLPDDHLPLHQWRVRGEREASVRDGAHCGGTSVFGWCQHERAGRTLKYIFFKYFFKSIS